jgi:hypothetical protein
MKKNNMTSWPIDLGLDELFDGFLDEPFHVSFWRYFL